jgi:hypothetical protein
LAIWLLLGAASTASAQPFLGLDVFGGALNAAGPESPPVEEGEEPKWNTHGWEVGANLRLPNRWIGVTGTVARTWFDDTRMYHVLAGPRVTTPFYPFARAFGHVLVGGLSAHTPTTSQGSFGVAIGGGVDLFLARLQFDYYRIDVDGVPQNNSRFFLGGVFPFCFRGCGPDDGFNVGDEPSASPARTANLRPSVRTVPPALTLGRSRTGGTVKLP